jgi:hypothetical protein
VEARAGRAVGADDLLGEQVVDAGALARAVDAEEVVEGVVLPDDDDDVLDGGARAGRGALRASLRTGRRRVLRAMRRCCCES